MLTEHPIYTDSMAHYPYHPGMEASLKFISTYGDEVSMGIRQGDQLLVPRGLAPSLGKDFRINRFLGAIDCKTPPRNEMQVSCITQSVALLRDGVDHILEAPTGGGKTYMATAIACQLGQATLIVVPKQDLMDSWHHTLVHLVGIPEKEIGIAKANKLKYKGCRFVLGMVQSLIIPDKYDHEFWSSFGLLIVDECHHMAADSFVRVCQKVPAKYRLGLSATPKRGDGKTPVLRAHIGQVMVKGTVVPMKPKVLIKSTGWHIPPSFKKVDAGRMMAVYKAMAGSTHRNLQIAEFVAQAYGAGRNTVVISDTLEHLAKLQIAIGQLIPAENTGFYVGGKSKDELKINAHKRVVLATYGMVAEGTDYPHWDTLVMATPRANVKQPLGRILRSKEGKKEPVCLDLVDESPIFRGFYRKRQTQYYSLGAKIVQV